MIDQARSRRTTLPPDIVDRVANCRIYNEDGTTSLGKIGQWFEEAYRELTAKTIYKGLIPFGVTEVHNGYFSQDRQVHAKDTRDNTADDDDIYSLIVRDKERRLDPKVALRFIFSHSALREGWDNPNVFQICTLNETQAIEKKRQEIGRGLRLSVNATGERVHDETVNRLTVIANESYEDFARTLQTEFEEDFGIQFGKVERIVFAKLVRRADDGTETAIGQDESAKIWGELVANGYLNADGDILDHHRSERAPGAQEPALAKAGGEAVPASEKLVSLFEPHADIIVKGGRDVQYGHKPPPAGAA